MGTPGTPPDVALLHSDASGSSYLVTLYGFWLETTEIPDGDFSRITLPGAAHLMQVGDPDLPKLDVSAIVPDYGDVYCAIAQLDTVEFDIPPVISSRGSLPRSDGPDTIPYTFNDIYWNEEWFPETDLEPQAPFILSDFRGVTVQLNVFRHNPTLGKLVVARQFELTITHASPQFVYRDSIAAGFLGIYEGFFGNFSAANYGYISSPRMRIVTADQFYGAVQPLRDWKMKKGIRTEVVKLSDIGGADTAAIRQYIHTQRWQHGVTFFLLVGDHPQLPSPTFPVEYPPPYDPAPVADPLYAAADHTAFPYAFIGRLSGNTTPEIVNQVSKIIWYERLPVDQPIQWPWTRMALVMAQWTDGSRACKERMALVLEGKCALVQRLYDHAATPASVSAALNDPAGVYDGRGLVNFIGSGQPWRWHFYLGGHPPIHAVFHTWDVFALQNHQMTPVVISVAKLVGDFRISSCCFAEAWLRVQDAGAVAFYGQSDESWIVEPVWADSVIIRSLTEAPPSGQLFPYMLGPVLHRGGISMIERYPEVMRGPYQFYTWHLFGDPTTQVRLGLHQHLRVRYPNPAYFRDVFVVTVTESYPPFDPLSGAAVCLWKPDDDYHACSLTGIDGRAHFSLEDLQQGPMYVTVTRHDRAAYEGITHVTWEPPPVDPDQASQAGPVAADPFADLGVSPSVSGQAFVIRVPTYAQNLQVFDRSGRVVNQTRAQRGEFLWQGTDQQGRRLPEGIYFIKATGRERTEVHKVLLVR